MRTIKVIRVIWKQYLLNSIQKFLVTVKTDLWNLNKDRYLILYIIRQICMPKISRGLFQNNQRHFIFFSQPMEYVVSHKWSNFFCAIGKVFLNGRSDPAKHRLLLIASMDIAAININGNAIHSDLNIPCRGKLLPLNDTNKAELRNKYLEVFLSDT